jgi:hypothetical protein
MCQKPATKVEARTAKVTTIGTSTVLWITDKSKTTAYRVESIASHLGGRAFQLSKADCGDGEPATYSVLLDGAHSTCDCPWGTYGANKKACRHVAALNAVLAKGQLF